MANKKLTWKEIDKLPRIHLRKPLMKEFRKMATKRGLNTFEFGEMVIKAGLGLL